MYNEQNNEKGYFFRNLIVKVLLVLLFVFLLMWLFPMPNLNPFYDKIFTENINNMTDAAKGYFTTSRLPKEENETKTLTLKEMLDNKMVIEFTDSDGKACDVNKSYVEVTNKDGEYVFKTNLSCSNKEDYVIEYFGCYDVCSDGTCDEKTPTTETKEITEYRFYKLTTTKLIDKYVCKSGYTLEGVKCVLKTNVKNEEEATLSCANGYTYNANSKKCEKEVIESDNADKTCKSGYIYATSMDKCIKLDTNVVDADLTYKCENGKLSGTKCILTDTTEIDATKEYSCDEGVLDESTKTCTVSGTKEEDAEVSYKCATGTPSGTKCIITTTSTNPVNCTYTSWSCSQPTYSSKKSTASTSIFTRKFLYQTTSGYKYEECSRKQNCTGGDTVTSTKEVDAEVSYKCTTGTPSGTKCIVQTEEVKNANVSYKCATGTPNGTKCIISKTSEIDATKVYSCNIGVLDGTKCILSNVVSTNYTYTCSIGTLTGTKCIIKTTDKVDPSYVCKSGYTKVGTKCYKTTTTSDIYNAEIIYKTTTEKVYKWSRSEKLDGWTRTGETRTVKVNVTSK